MYHSRFIEDKKKLRKEDRNNYALTFIFAIGMIIGAYTLIYVVGELANKLIKLNA